MEFIWAIIAGFIIGVIARLLRPGKQHIPLWLTVVIGIAGAIIGNLLATRFRRPGHRRHRLDPAHPADRGRDRADRAGRSDLRPAARAVGPEHATRAPGKMGALVACECSSAVDAGVAGVRLASATRPEPVMSSLPVWRACVSPSATRPEPVTSSLPVWRACVSPSATRPRGLRLVALMGRAGDRRPCVVQARGLGDADPDAAEHDCRAGGHDQRLDVPHISVLRDSLYDSLLTRTTVRPAATRPPQPYLKSLISLEIPPGGPG